MNVNSRILNTDVFYLRQGKENAPKVLLLHGWGCSCVHYEPIVRAMEDSFDMLIPDFPGHGKSSEPPKPWAVADFADCIWQLLNEQHFLPCTVIAHSFGGRVALYLSTQHPDMFPRLMLTGCAGIIPEKTEEQKRKAEQYRKKKKAVQSLERIPILRSAAKSMMDSLRRQYGSSDYNALNESMRATFVKIVTEDLSPLLPKVSVPTLLIWGENDTETPLWMGKKMAAEIPDAGLVVFENDDHFAYLREWPRFVAIAKNFFS